MSDKFSKARDEAADKLIAEGYHTFFCKGADWAREWTLKERDHLFKLSIKNFDDLNSILNDKEKKLTQTEALLEKALEALKSIRNGNKECSYCRDCAACGGGTSLLKEEANEAIRDIEA